MLWGHGDWKHKTYGHPKLRKVPNISSVWRVHQHLFEKYSIAAEQFRHLLFPVEDRLIIPKVFPHFHEENEVCFTGHEEYIYEITDHDGIQITVHEDKK